MKFWMSVQLFSLGIGSLLPVAITAQPMPRTPPVLRVSVFDDAGVGTATLRRAEREASRVFQRADIDVIWLRCPQEQISLGRCTGASYPAHLQLLVVSRPRAAKTSTVGISFLSADGKGCQADVFYEPIVALQMKTHTPTAIILGHAMAHELGHLLLGTNSHSRDGLMRAQWNRGDLAEAAKGNLLFSAEESTRMRSRFTRDDSDQLADLVQEK